MKVVGKDKIAKFSIKHNQARRPLVQWVKKTEAAKWTKFADVRATFGTVDNPKGNEYIFDIGGNNYRLIALVVIKNETVIIRTIMTHEEYSKKYR
jgi:mRNA interferase HigB